MIRAWGRARTWAVIGFVTGILLIGGSVLAFWIAVGILRDRVVTVLGPGSEIAALRVGWSTVEVEGLRIQAGPGWPATDALRAERVVITPSVRTLLSDQVRVRSVTVTRPYLSALRTRDGRVQISGWAEVATRDSSVRMVLQSVDLVALQPYLVRAAETRVQKGTVDVELDSEVRKHHLRAPGRIVISDLEFAAARGAWDTFMGLPRGAWKETSTILTSL